MLNSFLKINNVLYQGQRRPMSLFDSVTMNIEHYLTPLTLGGLSPNSGDAITKHSTLQKSLIDEIHEKAR